MDMKAQALLLASALWASAQPDERVQPALKRVSEEAEAFATVAPKILAQETLRQKALLGPPRFRVRVGAPAVTPPPPRVRTREVVSEFGYSTWKDSPGKLHEFRRVVSLDGRQVENPEKARATLTMGIISPDDAVRKRMLRDFEKLGLMGSATDLSQLLLLFLRRNVDNYDFAVQREDHAGAERALVLSYRQRGGAGGLTIFEGRQAIHQKLQGELWVRETDGLPLRITLISGRQPKKKEVVRDEIVVDYAMSAHGALLPASAVYRQFSNDELLVENIYEYSSFKRFGAQTEIKFTEVP